MKKLFISLLLFFSIFFNIENVSAVHSSIVATNGTFNLYQGFVNLRTKNINDVRTIIYESCYTKRDPVIEDLEKRKTHCNGFVEAYINTLNKANEEISLHNYEDYIIIPNNQYYNSGGMQGFDLYLYNENDLYSGTYNNILFTPTLTKSGSSEYMYNYLFNLFFNNNMENKRFNCTSTKCFTSSTISEYNKIKMSNNDEVYTDKLIYSTQFENYSLGGFSIFYFRGFDTAINLINHTYDYFFNIPLNSKIVFSNLPFSGQNFDKNIYNNSSSKNYYYTKFKINGDDTVYSSGDIIYEETNLNISFEKKDNKIDNKVVSVDLKINFSKIDNNKYVYMISKNGGLSWETYTNNIELNIKNNVSIIAMITDKEGNYLTSSTYTITSIETSGINDRIDIITEELVSNNCKYLTEIICKNYKITFSDFNEYKYKYEISDDSGLTFQNVEKRVYNNSFTYYFKENKTLIIRVINLNDNSLNNAATLTVTGISNNISSDEQLVFFNKNDLVDYKASINIRIFNYSYLNFNYYISTDSGYTFLELERLNCINNICDIDKEFEELEGNIIVKITDKEGNYIKSVSFTYKYNEKNIFDELKNINLSNLSYFTDVFNKIKNTNIGKYMFLTIISSIVILVVKAMKR